jgi:hypothetical protein
MFLLYSAWGPQIPSVKEAACAATAKPDEIA